MRISHKHQFVFLCLPNSGSRAVAGWLGRYKTTTIYHHHNFIVPECAHEYFVFAVVRNPYAKAVSHWSFSKNKNHPICKSQTFEQYAKWTNNPKLSPEIKNEESRLEDYLSVYRRITKDRAAVEEYLMGHARLQGRTMTSSQQLSYAHHVDKIVHLENLNEEMRDLPFIQEIVQIPHKGNNRREHRDWKPYYTAEVEANIYEYFKEDFEKFGYPRIQQMPAE